jgi:hypothetical protein
MKTLLILSLLLIFVVPEVEARGRWFGRRRQSRRSNYQQTTTYRPQTVISDVPTVDSAEQSTEIAQPAQRVSAAQAFAQQEANLMASRLQMGHLMGLAPGCSFAGVGMGGSPNCGTCTPRYRMRLMGDAVAQGRNGMFYRSRQWSR